MGHYRFNKRIPVAESHFSEFQTRYKPIHSRFVKYCDSISYGVMEAKDLVQETVWVVLRRWDEIQKKDSLLAFMIGVANRQIKAQLRQMQRQTRFDQEKEALLKMEARIQNADLAYDIHLMYQAMEQLGEKEKECLVMVEISGFSIREVSEIQGDSEGAVKTRLSRARQRLKSLLLDNTQVKTSASTLFSILL